ncbi:carbohydrate kinase family protein [Entomobacter blattae]|uniref:Fructokinase n=1 Tax=Entomobacter blattae TaxID=2762277 RepID=A0A7H1NQB9_9PROT|nr:carbohydrate kinase [Entomobacter blattae]QNT77979.1 Fructokinase [Entomobacter blattae]
MIVVCGDVLIDFIPVETKTGSMAYSPVAGGSCSNIATAIGRLGGKVSFMGGVSTDFFGDMLIDRMVEAGVDTRYIARNGHGSTLAFVKLEATDARYAFFDENSASQLWERSMSPPFTEDVELIHIGSTSLIEMPIAASCEAMFKAEHGKKLLCIDPNCRPTLTKNVHVYRERIARLMGMADIIKLSLDDLEYVLPNVAPEEAAKRWLNGGASMVVITRGILGALGFFKDQPMVVVPPAEARNVVDTVGAGDTFIGSLLAFFQARGVLNKAKFHQITSKDMEEALAYAAKVAAMVCERQGANPPWKKEVDAR